MQAGYCARAYAVLAIRVHSPDGTVSGVHRSFLWVRVAAVILAVWWGLVFFGLIDLLAFLQGPEFHASVLLSTGWGLLFLFLVAAPLATVAVASRATASSGAAEVSAVAVAVAVGAVLSTSPRHLLVVAGLLLTV